MKNKKEVVFRVIGAILLIIGTFGLSTLINNNRNNSQENTTQKNITPEDVIQENTTQNTLESFDLSEIPVTCWQNKDFLVIQPVIDFETSKKIDEKEESIYIIVKNKSLPSENVCKYEYTSEDYLIDSYWGMAKIENLEDNFLFVDYGTTRIRGLLIFDLNSRSQYFSDSYQGLDDIYKTADDIIVKYWSIIDDKVKANSDNCPQFKEYTDDLWRAGFNEYTTLHVKTLKKEVGERVCVRRE
jgi:hypothetical protein